MSWRFAALFGALLLLPSAAGAHAGSRIACQKPAVGGATFTMTCADAHQSAPLTLVMRGSVDDAQHDHDTATGKPKTIAVLAAGKLRQTLSVDSDGVWLNSLQQQAFESADLNFDGYDDLKVWTATSAGPNSGYAYWLYDPGKREFERRPDLDDRLSGFDVSADPKTKTLSLSGRDSCCAWTIDIYRWANGKLAQMSGEESGEFDLGDALSDVASIQAFRKTSPQFCATRTSFYDAGGRIIKDVIETQGDPCDDAADYRKSIRGIDKSLNGTKQHGNITDVYRDGILLKRTILYDPPRTP